MGLSLEGKDTKPSFDSTAMWKITLAVPWPKLRSSQLLTPPARQLRHSTKSWEQVREHHKSAETDKDHRPIRLQLGCGRSLQERRGYRQWGQEVANQGGETCGEKVQKVLKTHQPYLEKKGQGPADASVTATDGPLVVPNWPHICSPLSVAVNSSGNRWLVLNLCYDFCGSKLANMRTCELLWCCVDLRTTCSLLIWSRDTITWTYSVNIGNTLALPALSQNIIHSLSFPLG